MKQKILKQTAYGVLIGLALWAAFTLLGAWFRGSGEFPVVSGHLVIKYGSEWGAVAAQCAAAVLCGILWCNGALIFRETDWNLLAQTGIHALVCMVPALTIAWVMHFMPRSLDGLMQYLRLFGMIYIVNWAVQYGRLRHSIMQINEKLNHKEKTSMKKRIIKRPGILAAVLALCICIPVAGVAVGNSGHFRDIMRGTAVVGTEYVQATGEIRVTGEYAGGKITVKADFLTPDRAPFSEIEELAVGTCRIVNAVGRTEAEFEDSEAATVISGQAVMYLPVQDLAPGAYVLQIAAFVGGKKADQPLPLKGFWECAITVE